MLCTFDDCLNQAEEEIRNESAIAEAVADSMGRNLDQVSNWSYFLEEVAEWIADEFGIAHPTSV